MSETGVLAFGRLLRALRLAEGLTIDQLAERARLTGAGVRMLENGTRSPSLATAAQLADAIGVPLDYLRGGMLPTVAGSARLALARAEALAAWDREHLTSEVLREAADDFQNEMRRQRGRASIPQTPTATDTSSVPGGRDNRCFEVRRHIAGGAYISLAEFQTLDDATEHRNFLQSRHKGEEFIVAAADAGLKVRGRYQAEPQLAEVDQAEPQLAEVDQAEPQLAEPCATTSTLLAEPAPIGAGPEPIGAGPEPTAEPKRSKSRKKGSAPKKTAPSKATKGRSADKPTGKPTENGVAPKGKPRPKPIKSTGAGLKAKVKQRLQKPGKGVQ